MLEHVDVLSLHLPLTPTTKDLVNRDVFAKMKKSAVLLCVSFLFFVKTNSSDIRRAACSCRNASRGGIVHERDLFDALSNHTIAGAALDALETEPPTKEAYGETFYMLDNVIITPHIGAATHEIQSLSARTVVDQLAKLLKGEEVENIVK